MVNIVFSINPYKKWEIMSKHTKRISVLVAEATLTNSNNIFWMQGCVFVKYLPVDKLNSWGNTYS